MSLLLNRLSLFPNEPAEGLRRFRRVWFSFAAFAIAVVLAAICAPRAHAQASFGQAVAAAADTAPAPTQPTNIYALGLAANPGESPSVSGTAMYAHSVTGSGTYAGAIMDILPQTVKPIVVNTNIGAFVAQRVATVAGVPLFTTGSTGVGLNGVNVGWNWTGGGAAFFRLPKPNWYVVANLRVSKSTVSGATDYQLIPGVQIAWGN